MVADRDDASDVLQESFIEAFAKIKEFRFESSFGAWMKRITVNKCIDFTRQRATSPIVYSEDEMINQNIPEIDESIDEEALQLSVERVKDAMQKLSPGFRQVFSLYSFEGYDHIEIAQILNISEGTSKSQYMRAKAKMKEILKYKQS